MIAVPLGLGLGLTFGKLLGETLEWGKLATVSAECVIAGGSALTFAIVVNFCFGIDVEVTEKKL
jgi:hypothetical protein